MNCHPLIILIILNFKREPKSSLRNRQYEQIKLRTSSGRVVLYWKTTVYTQIKKTIGYTLNMRLILLLGEKTALVALFKNNYN
jgi:hypothetical protein